MVGGRAIVGLVLTLWATAAGCDDDAAPPVVAPSPPSAVASPGPGPARGCGVPDLGPVDAASVLVPGPSNGLPRATAQAERMLIDAVVLDARCHPVPGVSLDIWHTDARGRYGPPGTEECCYYQGTVLADRNGRFRLETIRPARYPEPGAPPAHVHLEIRHGTNSLDTEIVFPAGSIPPVVAPGAHEVPVALTRVGDSWQARVALVLAT